MFAHWCLQSQSYFYLALFWGATLVFYKHMEFSVKAFMCLKMCWNKTPKAFMCLKSVLFPVLTLPNPAVKAFYVLFFSKNLCLFLNSKGFKCLIGHVLIKNECTYITLSPHVHPRAHPAKMHVDFDTKLLTSLITTRFGQSPWMYTIL